jgi:hypothetical protein
MGAPRQHMVSEAYFRRIERVVLDFPQVPGIAARAQAVGRSSPGPLPNLPIGGACPPDLGSAPRVGLFSKSLLCPYLKGAREACIGTRGLAVRVISENPVQKIKAIAPVEAVREC